MTPKDVIAQAEIKFLEEFGKLHTIWLTDKIKEFIFSTYTKDLLQSVQIKLREEVEGKFGVEQMMALGNFQKALSDIINNLKR